MDKEITRMTDPLTPLSDGGHARRHPDEFSHYSKAIVIKNPHKGFSFKAQHRERYQGEGGHFYLGEYFFSPCQSNCDFPIICVLSVKSSEFN